MSVSLIVLIGFLGGCGSTREVVCSVPADLANVVVEDAITLDAFQKLPPEAKGERRARAEIFLDQAENSKRSDVKIMALTNAAYLAPDNQDTWLKLAHIWRWFGDYITVETCSNNAMAALEVLDDQGSLSRGEISKIKKSTSLDQALLRAWLHYDRGEWSKGLRWAYAADRIEPGSTSVHQITGLLEASSGVSTYAMDAIDDIQRVLAHSTDATWILAALDRSQKKWEAASGAVGTMIPNGDHVAECYREMALLAEIQGDWGVARRFYGESWASIPVEDETCLTKRFAPRLDPGSKKTLMPVWLAFNRYYITGSRSAYTSLALKKFEMAEDSVGKDFWGGQVVNSAGILIRWDVDPSYAYRARGLVFMEKGKIEWGLRDLRSAAKKLAAKGLKDSRIEGVIGHALLLEEYPKEALVHLRASVDLDPNSSTVWSDLGMALVQLGKSEEGERALTMAIGLNPSLATAWYNRGLVYIHRKDWLLAEQDLMKAAELVPDNAEIGALLQQLKQRNAP